MAPRRRWVHPSPVLAGPDDASSVLTDEQVRSWNETGACIVDGLWPAELVARVKAEAEATFRGSCRDSGGRRGLSSNLMSFPAQQASLNEMSLHPRLLTAMSQLLRVPTTELRLTQSELWEKDERNRSANYDQRIHMVGRYLTHVLLLLLLLLFLLLVMVVVAAAAVVVVCA
jgi:hypothetical protein